MRLINLIVRQLYLLYLLLQVTECIFETSKYIRRDQQHHVITLWYSSISSQPARSKQWMKQLLGWLHLDFFCAVPMLHSLTWTHSIPSPYITMPILFSFSGSSVHQKRPIVRIPYFFTPNDASCTVPTGVYNRSPSSHQPGHLHVSSQWMPDIFSLQKLLYLE